MANRRTGKVRPVERAAAIAMAVFWMSAPAQAGARAYELPEETARLLPGRDVESAEVNCVVCHSVDYINVQPRGKGKAFWTAEVNKMIKVYGAPIEQGDAAKIIEYLAATY